MGFILGRFMGVVIHYNLVFDDAFGFEIIHLLVVEHVCIFLQQGFDDMYPFPNIKLYIRDKMTKADGTHLDERFDAVANDFLHSLFSQFTISLIGVTTTQALNYIYTALISRPF